MKPQYIIVKASCCSVHDCGQSNTIVGAQIDSDLRWGKNYDDLNKIYRDIYELNSDDSCSCQYEIKEIE